MDIKTWTPIYSKFPINKDEFNLNPGFHPLIFFKTENGYIYLSCTSKIDKQKDFQLWTSLKWNIKHTLTISFQIAKVK